MPSNDEKVEKVDSRARPVAVYTNYEKALRLREMAGEAYGDGTDDKAAKDELSMQAMRDLEDAIERETRKDGFILANRFTRRPPGYQKKQPPADAVTKPLPGMEEDEDDEA